MSSRVLTLAVVGPLTHFALAMPCAAQTDSASSLRWCWRGQPLPQCEAFWITESDADVVISTTTEQALVNDGFTSRVQRSRHFMNRWVFTIGPMFNTAPLRAMGGTVSISPVYNRGFRLAAELRRRWWTPEGSALDLTVGPVVRDVRHVDPWRSDAEIGLTTAVYLVGGDYVNVNGRVDLLLTGRKPIIGTSWGGGFGSRPAVYVTIVVGLLGYLLISTYHEAT